MMRGFACLLLFAGVAAIAPPEAAPQAGRNNEPPPNWRARYDDGAVEERRHVVMRPGWHVFAGPAALLWEPGMTAGGNFSVTSEVFLFAAGEGESLSRDADQPYGIFVGGAELDGEQAAYTLLAIRDDRRFRIVSNQAGALTEIVPWTESEAVAALSEGDTTVENVLAVDATEHRVGFFVNDQQVADLPRGDLDPEGIVGLRAGAGVSLHVTSLAIGPNRR